MDKYVFVNIYGYPVLLHTIGVITNIRQFLVYGNLSTLVDQIMFHGGGGKFKPRVETMGTHWGQEVIGSLKNNKIY